MNKWMYQVAVSVGLMIFSGQSFAYYTFQETGDLLAPGRYAVGGELQFQTSKRSGVNILGRFDGAISDEMNYRGFVGLGDVDFQAGGYVKWVPFPDFEKQPAIGITLGGLVASYTVPQKGSNTEFSLRATPFISKSFDAELGQFTPYAALPVGARTYDGDSDGTLQLIVGNRFIHPEMLGAHFFGEVGFDFDNTFGFISVGATFPLNEDNLIELWP